MIVKRYGLLAPLDNAYDIAAQVANDVAHEDFYSSVGSNFSQKENSVLIVEWQFTYDDNGGLKNQKVLRSMAIINNATYASVKSKLLEVLAGNYVPSTGTDDTSEDGFPIGFGNSPFSLPSWLWLAIAGYSTYKAQKNNLWWLGTAYAATNYINKKLK